MRAKILTAVLCAIAFYSPSRSSAFAQQVQPPILTCSTLAECLTLLQKPYPCAPDCLVGVSPYAFIDDQGGYFSLPARFETFDRPAMSALIGLLHDPDWTIRARAGMVIANLSAVETADLPDILQESRNGNEWIAPSLARIGTPEALRELINVVRKSPFLDKPHGLALTALGGKAVPFVLEALSCKTDQDCSFFFVETMGELGASQGIQSSEIQERLIEIAATSTYSRYIRTGALSGLKGWQPYDDAARLRLRPLLQDGEPTIRSASVETLGSWGDAVGLPLLLEAIEGADRNERYRLLAVLESAGPAAISAGSALTPKLSDDDWDFRAEIAKVLGKIGYAPAAPELISSITPADWNLTYAAMVSLRQLGSAEGRDAIRAVAQGYWQPGMRLAAQSLLDETSNPAPSDDPSPHGSTIEAGCAGKLPSPQPPLASHPDLTNAIPLAEMIPVAGGRLALASSEGGGELAFQPEQGLPVDLIRYGNVVALLQSGQAIYAVAGSQTDLDNGLLHRIEQDPAGKWWARTLWRLPGAPQEIINARSGVIGLVTSHGDVIFRADSGMEWISCPVRE